MRTSKSTHGGSGRGQGDIRQHHKDVADETQYPRLYSFFGAAPASKRRQPDGSDGSLDGGIKPSTKRQRSDTPVLSLDKASAIEPPDVAPAASSYLLGKGGVISQALSALRSGDEPNLFTCNQLVLHVYPLVCRIRIVVCFFG